MKIKHLINRSVFGAAGMALLFTATIGTSALASNPLEAAAEMAGNVADSVAKGADTFVKGFGHGAQPILDKLPGHMQMLDENTKFQFPPSYITVPDNRKLKVSDFEDPAVCAGCHPKQYEGWKGSMHNHSFKDPIFQKLWHMGEVATGGKLMNHCGGCHSPIGVTTQTIVHDKKNGKFTTGPLASQGVSCDVCHTITKTNFLETKVVEHGNASFEIDPRGPAGRKMGPLKDAKSPYHKTEYSPLHKKADFCGNCHQIFNPANGFPVERTYDEWKYSVYARNDIVCQDCHMNPVAVAERVAKEMKPPRDLEGVNLGGFAGMGAGKQREVVHQHNFVGGNTVVPALLNGKDDSHVEQAKRRLASAAQLDLNLESRKDGLHDLTVKVTNVGAGHNLPTSLTDVREIWVQVTIKDAKGKVLYSNGELDSHGELDHANATVFNSVAVNAVGEVTHLPWEVSRFVSNTSIPPKGYSTSRYTFTAPKGSKITADVKLNYRSYSQHLADTVLGHGVITIPVIEMEHETLSKTL